jgi:hypothetical protein
MTSAPHNLIDFTEEESTQKGRAHTTEGKENSDAPFAAAPLHSSQSETCGTSGEETGDQEPEENGMDIHRPRSHTPL